MRHALLIALVLVPACSSPSGGDDAGARIDMALPPVDTGPPDAAMTPFDGSAPPARCGSVTLADVTAPTQTVGDGTAASCTEAALRTAAAAGGVIVFDCGADPVTITVTSQVVFTAETVIDGGGIVTLSGGGTSRIFYLDSGYDTPTPRLTVQRLTFRDGHSTRTSEDTDGGGAAIYRDGGSLTVIDSVFLDNHAPDVGQDLAGGAIYAFGGGDTIISGCTFTNNSASDGGAIGSLNGDLTVVNSTFDGNEARGTDGNPGNGGCGGALYQDGRDELTSLCGVTIRGSRAGAIGGGIFRVSNDHTGTFTMDRSTVDGNVVTPADSGNAGGLYLEGLALTITNSTISRNEGAFCGGLWINTCTVTMTNDTIAENVATFSNGGGMWLGHSPTGTMLNCTIANNHANGDGVVAGAIFGDGLTMVNTIVANNTAMYRPSCDVEHTNGGGNLQWPAGGTTTECATAATDADPMLGALGGTGETEVMVPASGGPADGIGVGSPRPTSSECPARAAAAPRGRWSCRSRGRGLDLRRMQRLSLGLVLLALGLFGTRVGWGWLVERPVLDDDELRAAEAAVDEALADARGGVCERPVLRGVPIPDDATSDFAAMLDPHGRFASCWSLLADRHDEVIAALTVDAAGEEGRAELPIDEQPRGVDSGPEVDPDWTYPAFGRSLRRTPLPVERDVLARCAGLDAEVEQIVRHASVCTPAPIGSALGMEPLLHLGNALAIFVRDRLRNGAIREGFELALDDVRLAQDAMRGRPDLLVALSAALSIRGAVGQLQILLPSELPVDDEALRALEVEARILATTTPSPDRIVRDELIVETLDDLTALGWTPPAGVVLRDDADAAHADPSLVRGILGVTLAHAGFSEGLACAPDTTREECHRRWTSEHTHVEAEAETGALVTLFGPRAARDTIAREAWPERLASLIRHMDRLVQAEAFVRALPAFVAHRRLRGVDACPDLGAIRAMLEHDEEVAWAMQDFGGRLSAHATSLEYGAIDLAAPTWLSDRGPDVRLPLLELYCVRFPLVP